MRRTLADLAAEQDAEARRPRGLAGISRATVLWTFVFCGVCWSFFLWAVL